MFVDIGYYALFGAVLLTVWSIGAFLIGGMLKQAHWVRSGERALHLVTVITLACTAILVHAIHAEDYSVAYVAQVSDKALPQVYKLTALWAGMDGSMLLWLAVLAVYTSACLWSLRNRHREMVPWIGLTLAVVTLFWVAMLVFQTHPLRRLDFLPADGKGMNPSLQNYWMAIHPPTLYLGYVGLTVPFAFAIGALVSGRLDETWIRLVRRWTLFPWVALGIGMIFGGRWAYEEIGWGGYWAWDPVENASFMPWLTATAFLHSVMVQERRGMFKVWNLILVIASFVLSIFGTFLTRSGIVESVHSFAQSDIGSWFLAFVILTSAVSAGLIYYRLPSLRAVHRIDSLLSREFSFMLNNLALVAICLVTLFLTMYAPISELFVGERWTVGAPAFNQVNGKLALFLLVLTGIGPVIAWRRASLRSLQRSFLAPTIAAALVVVGLYAFGFDQPLALVSWGGAAFVTWCIGAEFHRGARVVSAHRDVNYFSGLRALISRNRRRYGGYIVHLAVAMFFIGVAGMLFKEQREVNLAVGESVTVHGHVVRYEEPLRFRVPGSNVYSVRLSVAKEGQQVAELRPEFKIHDKFPEPEKDVAIHQTMSGDLYAILGQVVDPDDPRVTLQVLWNPLVAWVWGAGWLLLFGTAVCAWPDPAPAKRASAKRRQEAA
ncbi:MAG: heme lyase CcmF/NrfE family subunit [Acidobacteriota bacterium]